MAMGSYARLSVGGYEIYSLKSEVDAITMSLFTEDNRRAYISQDEQMRYESDLKEYGSKDEIDPLETTFEYRSTVGDVIERLEVMGFTLDNATDYFNEMFDDIKPDLEDDYGVDPEFMTLENWMKALGFCVDQGIPYYELGSSDTNKKLNSVGMNWFEVLMVHGDENILGFPGNDVRLAIRSILEIFDDEEEVILDYSDLVNGGYSDEGDRLCESMYEDLSHTFRPSEKAIVLTEGSSDASILKLSMNVLYPHLSDLFSFLDFSQEEFKPEGGAAFIVKILKVLVSAKVGTKVIAIFDNDAAARDALRSLRISALPSNVKVIILPELGIAKNYPTVGPGGQTCTDINGRALSLELFFGKDALLREDGSLTPVRWTSFNNGLKDYQGEIENKDHLQRKYRSILNRIQQDPAVAKDVDLDDMHTLLGKILYAFRDETGN